MERINPIIEKYNQDPTRLMDILIDIQTQVGYIPAPLVPDIAEALSLSSADVEQTISFYHFFSLSSRGQYTVYLNDSAVANMMGRKQVAATFEQEAGCQFGQVSENGIIGLFNTSCIGMNDQEPAAIINGAVFTRLTPFRVRELVKDMRAGKDVDEMFMASYGDGNNSSNLIKAVVNNNIRKIGPILSSDYQPGQAIKGLADLSPEQVIDEMKISNMRGRGGAGFPTGLKWELCRKAVGSPKYIFCNADEGEPGTFKDRVILTERPKLIFEGMVVAAYAVGASQGLLYLRFEYKYLQKYLEKVLQEMRENQQLGKNIDGKEGFDFDIRIQFGAGSYVCGEESALIESAEGKRGEPRDRPPFPVEKGYLNKPTVVNNVETFCSVVKIVIKGGEWYKSIGTSESSGTKVLSISGDCRNPGIYEVEWGFNVNDILDLVGADPPQAIQVGGPSGSLIGPEEFNRTLGYEDLATGGSFMIIGPQRDLLQDIVLNHINFFIDESCGSCTPCRALTVLYKEKLLKIINGKGVKQDLNDLQDWSYIMKGNRCGLGMTALNPVMSSLKNFRQIYEQKLQKDKSFDTGFNLHESIMEACEVSKRTPQFK